VLILIVEDEAELARLIRLYLEKEGFTCEVCEDGETALRYQQTLQPDLIILDVMLPKLDGLEVCSRIRQGPGAKDPYILMLTARGEEIDRIIGLSSGADDYLVKPCCAAACATAKTLRVRPTAPPTSPSTSISAPPTASLPLARPSCSISRP
jgi:DNA-binding response OmpR family regulator